MSNLSNFADLMKQATEDKKIREAEKLAKTAPLLSELFATISKGKEVSKETSIKEAPLLAELQSALLDPEKFKNEKEDKRNKIVQLVTELEVKAAEIQTKIDTPISVPKEVTTDLEKKFLKLFNRLQNDFQTLKKHVENTRNSGSTFGGSSGSGEVRILRMDDVVKTKPVNGDVLVWDSALNMFKPAQMSSGGTTTDEEMPYAKRVDFITDNELYKGEAAVGSLETSSVWRIHKLVIGADGDVSETWASGVSTYTFKWSDRLIYTYI
jgi:hypothetical protein